MGQLISMTFKELYSAGLLPSGATFELMPDTVEVALAVAEVSDPYQWKKKALEAFTITKTIGGIDVQEHGPELVYNLSDTDVIFLSLAWTAQLNSTKMPIEGGIPCPTCNKLFHDVDFGELKVNCRQALDNSPKMFLIDGIDEKDLPKSLRGGKLAIGDMTWKQSRQRVSEASWENPEAVKMHRILSGLHLMKNNNGKTRFVAFAESRKMRAGVLKSAAKTMDENIPSFEMTLGMVCNYCGEIAAVPFTQGLG